MKLAKQRIDVGLYTNRREEQLAHWQGAVGLPFEELLPAGRGVHQLRHGLNGSVLKINHVRDPLPDAAPSGYRELWIARDDLERAETLRDPDGNVATVVPRGRDGIEGIGVGLAVRDPAEFHRFYGHALELPACGENAYRCGDSVLRFARAAGAGSDAPLRAPGFRYITIQVWDADAEHARIVERGGREGMAPVTLGEVARISFVRDPDGNWIEISQRASLTGPVR